MELTDIPPGVADYLARCPKAGDGVNRWLFPAALKLHRANIPPNEMPGLLRQATKNCGRKVTDDEIERAIVNSGSSLGKGAPAKHRPKWPKRNREQIAAIIRDGASLDDLKQMSPVKWNDGKPHTEEIIDLLFPGNPLLCVGQSKRTFNTMPRDAWRGLLSARQFIVPSPMSRVFGVTKDGKRKSAHTLDNTGPRRFQIVEFDKGTFDEHAAILLHLARFAPLVLAVHSGSKSLHGWFFVHRQPEVKVEKFFRYAVSVGADKQLDVLSQFTRMPDGWRYEKNTRQAIIYFNPSPIKDTHAN